MSESNAYGRTDSDSCFNQYGQLHISNLMNAIENADVEKVSLECNALRNHGSYEYEAMMKALPATQGLENSALTYTVIENCGYMALNATTGNYTVSVYATADAEQTINACGDLLIPTEEL